MKKWNFYFSRTLGIVFLTAAVFFFGSCFARPQSASASERDKLFGEAGLHVLNERISARDFSLPNLNGEIVSLQELRGQAVVLYFWATWCGPCRAGMPSLQALHDRYRENGLEVLAVNIREAPQHVQSFISENNYTFPVLLDGNGAVSGAYGVRALPTIFIIDQEGFVVHRRTGGVNWDSPAVHAAFDYLLGY